MALVNSFYKTEAFEVKLMIILKANSAATDINDANFIFDKL